MCGRLIHRFWRPRVKLKSSPKLSKHTVSWQEPASRLPSMTGPFDFTFLNEKGNLIEVGWDGPSREKLWRYNQHYFDDLNAFNSKDRKVWHEKLIQNWIEQNPPTTAIGWDSYPLSLRIVNWIKWHLNGGNLTESALQSLVLQLRWLSKRLEIHLLGNHLFANAKALVFGGLFFEGKEAARWLKKGLRILRREVHEQILPDGGHFELSTMYHALAFEDLLDLINVSKCFSDRLNNEQGKQVSTWYGVVQKMHFWLDTMCHPDGEISFFNDSALGIAPSSIELNTYFKRLGIESSQEIFRKVKLLKDSGYIRITIGNAVAIVDVAKIGPDYLPGHAHADTLSFELSIDKQRVLVNSGTSCYGVSNDRLRQRGTCSHNTVMINGEDSSEVWSGFRVARRSCPQNLQINECNLENKIEVHCSQDGYCRLKGKPLHRRSWLMNESEFLVKDKVDGFYESAVARYHFHPDVKITINRNHKSGTLLLAGNKTLLWSLDHGIGVLEKSTWHPKFGVSVANFCLQIKLIEGLSTFRLQFASS